MLTLGCNKLGLRFNSFKASAGTTRHIRDGSFLVEGFTPLFMFLSPRIYLTSTSSWQGSCQEPSEFLLNQCGTVKGTDFSADEAA